MKDLKRDELVRAYNRIVSWSETDKIYVVRVPELPGCVTHGRTFAEAGDMADEAVGLYLESLEANGEPIPIPTALQGETKAFQLRLEMPAYQFVKMAAEEMKISMNEYVVKRILEGGGGYIRSSPEIRKKLEELKRDQEYRENQDGEKNGEKKLMEAIFGKKKMGRSAHKKSSSRKRSTKKTSSTWRK